VVDVFAEWVRGRRPRGGRRLVRQPAQLRHFTARFEPLP